MKKLLLAVLLAGIASAPVLEAKSAATCLRASRGCRKGVCRRPMTRTRQVVRARQVTRAQSVPVAAPAFSKPTRTCTNGMCSR